MRDGLHTNVWVNALFADYNPTAEKWDENGVDTVISYPRWIITDCRFPNEAVAIREHAGVLLRMNRNADTGEHLSETALDNFEFDYVIENTGTIQDLVAKLRVFYEKYYPSPSQVDKNKPSQIRDILS